MKTCLVLLPTIITVSLSSMCLAEESVSYFRRHGGVATDDARRFPADLGNKENLVWRQPLGPGHSTPCLGKDVIFVTTHKGRDLVTLALDREKGEQRWRRTVTVDKFERFHRAGSPASCTPACDGERVYVFFGSYGLLCYDFDGNQIWEHKLGPFQDEFGANSSPVLAGELLILNEDHDIDSYLVAVDRKTGKKVWRTAREGFTRSYSTPVIRAVDGIDQVIVAGSRRLVGYDLASGQKRWWVNGLARVVIPVPAQTEKMLYVASWTDGADPGLIYSMEPWSDARKKYDINGDAKISREETLDETVRSRFFRIDTGQDGSLDEEEWEAYRRVFAESRNAIRAIRPGGEGDVTSSCVKWRVRRSVTYVASPLVYRDVLYMVKDGGIITSLDLETGKILKQGRATGRGNYYSSPVAADGKIYLASERGVVTVLAARAQWTVLASFDFGERINATPVIDDGAIYLRTEKTLYRIEQR